jgi:hypothetical protein
MPAPKTLTITALLAVAMCAAGCNSSKTASSTVTNTAAATIAAAPAASAAAAVNSGAAAGASTPAAAGGSTAAGCPVTAAQATTAMGVTYTGPTSAYGICSYAGSDGNAFSIDVHDATGVFDFNGTLATAKQDQGTDTSTTIPGLGDKAAGTGQEIIVQSGGKTIDIRNADEAPWTKSIALAKLVIASLH